jgi:hypothetical protein
MDRYNIVDIAKTIQDGIKEYQERYPNDLRQESAEKYALGKVMRLGRGIYNPLIIKDMISLERSVYKDSTDMRC